MFLLLAIGAVPGLGLKVVVLLLVTLGASERAYFTSLLKALPPHHVAVASGLVDALGYVNSSLGTWFFSMTAGYGYRLVFPPPSYRRSQA